MTSSLRKTIWDDKDIGEALRDLERRIHAVNGVDVRAFTNFTYAPPIILQTDGKTPTAIHMGQVRVPGSPTNIVITISPTWDVFQGQVRINTIGGITVGVKYDLSFLLFYAN